MSLSGKSVKELRATYKSDFQSMMFIDLTEDHLELVREWIDILQLKADSMSLLLNEKNNNKKKF